MSLINRFLSKSGAGGRATKPEDQSPHPATRDTAPSKDTLTPAPPNAGEAATDIQSILRELDEIKDVIGDSGCEDAATPRNNQDHLMISMPLREILAAMPPEWLSGRQPIAEDDRLLVVIRKPFEQLAKGKVVAQVSDLAPLLPNELLARDFAAHMDESIPLPLARVVAAISPDELKSKTSSTERDPSLYALPDLFRQAKGTGASAGPSAPVAFPPAVIAAAAPIAPAAVRSMAPAASLPPPPQPVPAVQPIPAKSVAEEPRAVPAALSPATPPVHVAAASTPTQVAPHVQEPEQVAPSVPPTPPALFAAPTGDAAVRTSAPPILIRGVDINSAGCDELVDAFRGVGQRMAERIVARRPFATLYDLCNVQGIGRSLFKRITGEELPGMSIDSAEMNALLGGATGMVDLDGVAQRLAELPGVGGCIVSHADGYLMASAWTHGKGQSVGAIAPQIFKVMGKYFDLLQMSTPSSMLLFLPQRPLFITRCQDIILILFVSRSRLSVKRMAWMEALCAELTRRMRMRTGSVPA